MVHTMIKRILIGLFILLLPSICFSATMTYSVITTGGGDYTSLSACEGAQDGVNHAGNDVVINCSGTTDDTSGVTFDTSWTADSIAINGDWDGEGWDADAYILDVDGVALLIQDTAPVTIKNMQINIGSSYDECIKFDVSGVATEVVENCYLRTDNPSTGCYGIRCADGTMSAGSTIAINNVIAAGFSGANSDCYNFNEANLTVSMSNSIGFSAGRYGVSGSQGTVNIINSICASTAVTDFSGCESVTYSASDDTTTGTGNIDWNAGTTDYNAAWTDYSTGDFTMKDVDSSLYDSGTTPTPATDITGYTWTTDDVGPYGWQVAASTRRRFMVLK